jgi:hypothetical protein
LEAAIVATALWLNILPNSVTNVLVHNNNSSNCVADFGQDSLCCSVCTLLLFLTDCGLNAQRQMGHKNPYQCCRGGAVDRPSACGSATGASPRAGRSVTGPACCRFVSSIRFIDGVAEKAA